MGEEEPRMDTVEKQMGKRAILIRVSSVLIRGWFSLTELTAMTLIGNPRRGHSPE
jgi:hypothetical protein